MDQKYQYYNYYHYSNLYDGTRDSKTHQWIDMSIIFAEKHTNKINYDETKMMFLVLYNCQMDKIRYQTTSELLNKDTIFSKFVKKSLAKT